MSDAVNHPAHYTRGQYETIEVIEDWGLNYRLGNVLKYVSRAGFKGDKLEDLLKARWYLEREIAHSRSPWRCVDCGLENPPGSGECTHAACCALTPEPQPQRESTEDTIAYVTCSYCGGSGSLTCP